MLVALQSRKHLPIGLGDQAMGLPEDILGALLGRSTDVGPDGFDTGEAVAGAGRSIRCRRSWRWGGRGTLSAQTHFCISFSTLSKRAISVVPGEPFWTCSSSFWIAARMFCATLQGAGSASWAQSLHQHR
jgi:hypothetical protein